MSNIYIQEPPTSGKVLLKTSIGDILIELWSKECPKSCRNFIQLCMEGYYDDTKFHRIIKDFIAQGGDPTGTGEGGESIYGAPFKDEFHSRLRFNRRGLVGMANSTENDNGSQFFFTLGPCQELNKKHTLFGKVVGNTIYNMIKFNEGEIIDDKPVRAEKIISTEVIYNPFNDIKPRNLRAAPQTNKNESEDISKLKKGVKNYSLLSFGQEAEDDEEDLEAVSKVYKEKSKSAHDIGDPSLISRKVTEKESLHKSSSSSSFENDDKIIEKKTDLESIKSKLKRKDNSEISDEFKISNKNLDSDSSKRKETQNQIKKLQKELKSQQKIDDETDNKSSAKIAEKKEDQVVQEYREDVEKYEHLKKKKNKNKEDKTLELMNAFRERLFKAKNDSQVSDEENTKSDSIIEQKHHESENSNKTDGLTSILTHRLEIDEEIKQKVIDANMDENDRYDIYDPRNPLNKRKREESSKIIKEKKLKATLYK